MTDWPAPTRADHEAFCRREGWQRVYRGRLYDQLDRAGTDQITYVLALPDSRILRTRIGQPADYTPYGRLHASHVLRDQLEVPEDDFWACVLDGVLPDRGLGSLIEAGLPDQIVQLLNATAGDLPAGELETTARRAAIDHLREHWAAQGHWPAPNRAAPNWAAPNWAGANRAGANRAGPIR